MPPFWHGLNSLNLSMASTRSPSGIFSRASNLPVFVRSLTSISAVPETGFTVLASLSMWSQPARVVQPADHVDAVGREDVVAVVQVVLLGREHRDRRAGLLARIRLRCCAPAAAAPNETPRPGLPLRIERLPLSRSIVGSTHVLTTVTLIV